MNFKAYRSLYGITNVDECQCVAEEVMCGFIEQYRESNGGYMDKFLDTLFDSDLIGFKIVNEEGKTIGYQTNKASVWIVSQ